MCLRASRVCVLIGALVGAILFILWVLLSGSQQRADRDAVDMRLRHLTDMPIENGAEILAYDDASAQIFVTGHSGLSVLDLSDPEAPVLVYEHVFSSTESWEPTSVAIDPMGRGFAAISWIPAPIDRVPGVVQIVDTATHRVVWQMGAGYHPDCIAFTPNGERLLVANECEPGATDLAGGITLIALDGIERATDFQGRNDAQSFGFSEEHLGDGVDLTGIRAPSGERQRELSIEPEYLAATNEGVWVSLQENNALGYFDFSELRWTRIRPLGAFDHAFDGSDADGIRLGYSTGIGLLAQPDTIAHFDDARGGSYLLLANEGEQGDRFRIKLADAIEQGLVDPNALRVLDALNGGDARSKLGELRISSIDGDLDGDGDIDHPMAFGGRNIAIIDAQSGDSIWDSGAQIEQLVAERWPDRFNDGDSRSTKSGPEPEGLAIAHIDGRIFGFVGLERIGAVLMYELTEPSEARFVDAFALREGSSPEGLCVFTKDGKHYLAVASEKIEMLTIFEITDGL